MNIINQVDNTKHIKMLKKVIKKCYQITATSKKKTLSLIIVDSKTIWDLNKTYRNIDNATDVLTFPSSLDDELGDVFIAYEIALEQAEKYQHSLERELAFLAVHGFLHAIGYTHDHQEDSKQMNALQEQILTALNIPR